MTETNEDVSSEDTESKAALNEEEVGADGKKRRVRKPKPASKEKENEAEAAKDRPPWTGFRETPPSDAVITPAEAERARRRDGLVLAAGFSYYLCLRNCGNGRFAAGKTYALRDESKPHPDHFRQIRC